MKVLFMGTPDFAVPTLERLVSDGHHLVGVITQPDRPKGRGKKVTAPPVKVKALELELPVYQPLKVKDPEFVEVIKNLKPDVIVVVAFGQILSKAILEIPRYGCINVHASLLPKYRGAAPIHWSVIDGEKETGVTIMKMEEGLDTGPMLLKEAIDIGKWDTTGMIHDKLAMLGARLLSQAMELINSGQAIYIEQNHEEATYAVLLKREHEEIDWSRPAEEIFNQIKGLDPWPGAFTKLNGESLKIWSAEPFVTPFQGRIGEIVLVKPEMGIVVATGLGHLLITQIQPPGSKRMKTVDYLRGHSIQVGQFLGA